MKNRFLMVICAVAVIGILATPQIAGATFVNIADPIFGGLNYSPNANTPGQPTTRVSVNEFGSVDLGWTVGQNSHQPVGLYGAGVPLSPLGNTSRYRLFYGTNLFTWDALPYDTYRLVITQGNYLWNGGTVAGGFTWGGSSFGTRSYPDFNWQDWGHQIDVDVNPANGAPYLNVILQTTVDTQYPSWGTFDDVCVEPVATPEPASMAIFGMGLFGLVSAVRKKFKA